jgi:catechol 2,3-dioxygenase-like lactoylglutathione lyase family enzyme
MSMADRPPSRFDHAGLAVADLAAATAWYVEAFGLERELTLRIEEIELDIEMLRHPAYGYRIELLHRPDTAGGKPADPAQAALVAGYGHLAFDIGDLAAAYERLVALGARPVMAPRPAPEPGVRMAFVADPEGNLLELLQRS